MTRLISRNMQTAIMQGSNPVHRHAFPHFFCYCFFACFTWRCFDAFLLLFLLLVKCLELKNWFVLATGLVENLTHVACCHFFLIQQVRTRSLNCETWNFWYFYILINMKLICVLWCYCLSSCCVRVILWFESQKCMIKPYLPPRMYLRILSCICVFLPTAMYALSLARCVWEWRRYRIYISLPT